MMKNKRTISHRIIVIALAALFVPFISVCDCFMIDQNLDSFGQCEWDNHSFLMNPLEGKNPDSMSTLPLDPTFPSIAVPASQVFHPPAVV
jgi:hypothetical protein